MSASVHESVGFRCARDSIRKERRPNESDRNKDHFVLCEEEKVILEIGARREKQSFLETKIKYPAKNPFTQVLVFPLDSTHDDLAFMACTDRCPDVSYAIRTGNPSTDIEINNEVEIIVQEKESSTTSNCVSMVHIGQPSSLKHETAIHLDYEVEELNAEEEASDYFTGDVQCAWCDDGGRLVMCDGPCMRGFHMEKGCNPLKVQEDLRTAIVNSKHPFECPNCWAKIHRCFECRKEFKLDIMSDKPLISKCDVVDCGRFYCTKCAKQLSKESERRLGIKNKTESSFICPLHFCKDCGSKEDHSKDILFPCRRCPVALHERCMSRKLRDDPTRVWRVLLDEDGTISAASQVSANFFYCGKHKTQNMMQGPEQEQPFFSQTLWKKWRTAYALKYRSLKSSIPFLPQRMQSNTLRGEVHNLENFTVASMVLGMPKSDGGGDNSSLQENQFLYDGGTDRRRRKKTTTNIKERNVAIDNVIEKDMNKVQKCREQVRELIDDAMKDISIDQVEDDLANTYPYSSKTTLKLTDERLDYFIRSVEQSKYDPQLIKKNIPSSLIKQMDKSLRKMRVACAPFIFPKYTSFGRHFTKTNILEHVANHMIAYLNPNDMVVDFSCGSNEFLGMILDFCRQSNLEIRVKAFDLFTPFRMDGFVRKNWLDVKQDELDDGDKLIIGLNPPFGVNASLADKFTIVPRRYRIIHENSSLCANKAFYIPGLRTDQGNDVTPPFRVLKRIS